jgi:type I restriction enzyme S subunit
MNNNKKLIPKLRFPKFSETWKIVSIADICQVYRGSAFSKADINKNGSKPCIHYGELFTKYGEVINKVYSKTNKTDGFQSEVGDVLMPSSDVTPDGLAKASAIMLGNVILGGDMNILRPQISVNSIFLSYLLNVSKSEIIKFVSGTTVKHIYPSQIINCCLPIASALPEQQKIADCLCSLDDLIAAESQKLALLKEHKKGLMQRLFPQEGQKTPVLRFPEFEKEGKWVEKRLGEIGEPLMCKRVFKEQTKTDPQKGIPFYKIGTFGKKADAYISVELYEELKAKYPFPKVGDILISASGTIGRLVIYDGSPAYFQDSNIVWLNNDEKFIINKFLYYCYSILRWQTSDGGIINRLYNSDLTNISIKFPEKKREQQKIADCLSSLDDLIAAQAEKIELLKLHKKGLMQGLFPKWSEL